MFVWGPSSCTQHLQKLLQSVFVTIILKSCSFQTRNNHWKRTVLRALSAINSLLSITCYKYKWFAQINCQVEIYSRQREWFLNFISEFFQLDITLAFTTMVLDLGICGAGFFSFAFLSHPWRHVSVEVRGQALLPSNTCVPVVRLDSKHLYLLSCLIARISHFKLYCLA